MRKRRLTGSLAVLVAISGAACSSVMSGEGGPPKDNAGADAGAPADPNAAAESATIARLTNVEYTNTLHDLFPSATLAKLNLPREQVVDGFENNSGAQVASAQLVEAYASAARAIGDLVTSDPTPITSCAPRSPADEDACAADVIKTFGKRAFRRPLAPDEIDRFGQYFAAEKAAYGFKDALGLLVQAFLQSPTFLYRVELASPLSPYEMASRLSYFLWDTMPDDALFAAADSGALANAQGVEAQARRMLQDQRAHAAVASFHRQWLRFSKMDGLVKSADLFPKFNDATAASMRASAARYVDHLFWDKGTLGALLGDTQAYVDDNLADIYGVTSPGATLTLVDVDPTQRAGILTHAGLLAGFAHETSDAPVLRGVFVLDRLMCSPTPPPPKNVNTTPPQGHPGDPPRTTRDRFAQQHEQGVCAGCHHTIDGVGFGFEHYDAVGAWRTQEDTINVDASGWLVLDGQNQTFNGAVELSGKLAQSKQVGSCVASQWLRYALGASSDGVAPQDVDPIYQGFAAKNFDMRELLVALVTSDAFRNRRTSP